MTVPGVSSLVAAFERHLPEDAAVRVLGPHAKAVAEVLSEAGVPLDPASGAAVCYPNLLAAGPLVPTLADVAAQVAPGAVVVVSDLVWRTAPTPALLQAFPGTMPMEGYEMQAEHGGFEVVDRLEDGAEAFHDVDVTDAKRDALAGDDRGAALWWTLVLRRVAP